MRRHPNSRLLGGATEIGVEVNKRMARPEVLIATEGVDELRRIVKSDSEWRIRGGATLTSLEEVLAGEFPILDKMLNVFASRAIRNRATLAGNLVTASPIGDMPPFYWRSTPPSCCAPPRRFGPCPSAIFRQLSTHRDAARRDTFRDYPAAPPA